MVLITVRLRTDILDNANTKPVHRLEVFTGAGRRRTWSAEDKALIVAEITPACDSAVAIPNPMPDAASVTTAVRPVRSCMCVLPLHLQLALADTYLVRWFIEFRLKPLLALTMAGSSGCGGPRATPGSGNKQRWRRARVRVRSAAMNRHCNG